jgi:hypothetical protein
VGCKSNVPYYSFFSKEVTRALKEYLDERLKDYGNIGDNEPLFISTSTNVLPNVKRHTAVKRKSLK